MILPPLPAAKISQIEQALQHALHRLDHEG
jgi:hypothetical protein